MIAKGIFQHSTAHKVIFFQFLLLRQIIDDIMSKGQKVITGCLRNKISW